MATKAKKREPLVVGQRVFIETAGGWAPVKERSVFEAEIVEVNKSSAYAVNINQLTAYNLEKPNLRKYMCDKIDQRTHQIKDSTLGYYYRLWLSKEDFERSVELQKEKVELLKQTQEKVKGMTLQQLREFVGV